MRQALHIFKKDVRHLRLDILIVLAAVAGFTYAVAKAASPMSTAGSAPGVGLALLTCLVLLAWWSLIARLIHDEPLAGEQPFWITRPYSRGSLVLAKALFIAVFVILPKLGGDTVILLASGFRVGPELSGLLWSQILLTGLLILPAVALSAVTAGFAQSLIALCVLGLTFAGWELAKSEFGASIPWLALEWVRTYSIGVVLTTAAIGVIAWQYAKRGTTMGRIMVIGAFLLVLLIDMALPWTFAFAVQSLLSGGTADGSTIRLGYDPALDWGSRAIVGKNGDVDLHLPLRISGIPQGVKLKAEGLESEIEGPSGELWRAGGQPPDQLRATGEFLALRVRVNSHFYEKVRTQPVRIRGSFYLTLYGNPRRTDLAIGDPGMFRPTEGVGVCSAAKQGQRIVLTCNSSLRPHADQVSFNFIGRPRFRLGAMPETFRTMSHLRPISYSPFPAEDRLIPVIHSVLIADIPDNIYKERAVRALAVGPVAHIRKDFEIKGVRLSDFEVRP